MKMFLKIVLAILAGIALSACRVVNDPPAPPEPPVVEDPEEEEQEEPDIDIDHENEIIDALEVDPHWNEALQDDPGEVLDVVLSTCVALESESVTDVVLDLMNDGAEQLSAEHMVEVSVFIVCPEFIGDYEEYVLSQR